MESREQKNSNNFAFRTLCTTFAVKQYKNETIPITFRKNTQRRRT